MNSTRGEVTHTPSKVHLGDRMGQCSSAADLIQHITAATKFVLNEEDAEKLLPALQFRYRVLMTELKMSDVDAVELMGMIAILTLTHARKLSAAESPQPPGRVIPEVL